ncbi:hypothetical protein ABT297_34675 [Dactylosporangium sp. NPDC000555]|uniref:hypothetical protein n=1 Tax=Dactylosporangium sp. NPDC000555 TaxID=3154260 RepID=UPI0033313415
MNCRTQMLLAAGVGYLLGRQHKLRWGLVLAAAAAAGRISGPGDILQRGVRALSGSKELGRLTELGAPLVAAGKDAARTAVTGQIESVTDRLRERTDLLRRPGAGRRAREAEPEEERARPRRRPAAREEEYEEYEEEQRPRRRPPAPASEERYPQEERPRRRPPAARRAEEGDEEYDEPDDEEREAPSGVARSRPDAESRPPVRRRGR